MTRLMNEMAKRFDPVFPEAGGLERLSKVRDNLFTGRPDLNDEAGETFFHPLEAEHMKKILLLLGEDEEAKSTLMSLASFAQMKSDLARHHI